MKQLSHITFKNVKSALRFWFLSMYLNRKLKDEDDNCEVWVWTGTVSLTVKDFEQLSRVKKLLSKKFPIEKWEGSPGIEFCCDSIRLRYWHLSYDAYIDIFIEEEQFKKDFPSCKIEEETKVKKRVVCGV